VKGRDCCIDDMIEEVFPRRGCGGKELDKTCFDVSLTEIALVGGDFGGREGGLESVEGARDA